MMPEESPAKTLLITGKLAEPALRRVLATDCPQLAAEVAVMPITVAALLTTEWIARHLTPLPNIKRVILPGLCRGDTETLAQHLGVPVVRGPEDVRDLPQFFSGKLRTMPTLEAHSIEILAEINHAPQLATEALLTQARAFRKAGAEVIDLGCDPGSTWAGLADTVKILVDEGFRVSVDSFNAEEVTAAVRAGAELVLSVNETNIQHVPDWLAIEPQLELVAIPNSPSDWASLDRVVQQLNVIKARYRLDPILEPIGFGFAASLGRYLLTRLKYPHASMMMGIGNLTELTEVDSVGINVLLAGFCQELEINSVLTTAVAPWCVSAVEEFNLARKLVNHAVKDGVPPKRVGSDLVLLRDTKRITHGETELADLARMVTDRNYRIFVEKGEVHVLNGMGYWHGADVFQLFAELHKVDTKLDASHAFYLGYELAKATTALHLGKRYEQDRALRWGFLTVPEPIEWHKPGHL